MRYLYIFILALSCLGTKADVADEALKFCEARNYNAAINLINEEIARNGASSGLYYDLGVAYYKAGNFGASALNFEKALRMDPSNSEAANNCKVIASDVMRLNESLTGDRNLDPSPQAAGIADSISNFISERGSDFWCILAVMALIIGIVGIGVYFLSAGVTIRKVGFFGGIGVIVLSVVLFLCALVARRAQLSTDKAVVMSAQVQLKSHPDATAKDIAAPLAGGTILKIISMKEDNDKTRWAEVYLNADYTGWLPTADLEIVTVPGMK